MLVSGRTCPAAGEGRCERFAGGQLTMKYTDQIFNRLHIIALCYSPKLDNQFRMGTPSQFFQLVNYC